MAGGLARAHWLYPAMLALFVVSLVLIGTLVIGLSVHSVVGLVFALALTVHVLGRGPWLARVWKSLRDREKLSGTARRAVARDVFLVLTATALTVTGLVQWAGVPTAKPWHSSATVLFTVALVLHLAANRRALGNHLRRVLAPTR